MRSLFIEFIIHTLPQLNLGVLEVSGLDCDSLDLSKFPGIINLSWENSELWNKTGCKRASDPISDSCI